MKKPWEENYGSAQPPKTRRQTLAEALDKVAAKPWEVDYQSDSPAEQTKYSASEGMSAGEKFLVGAGAATDRTIRGLTGVAKSIAGVVAPGNVWSDSPDAGAEDAALYKRNHPGGWATTGEIAGDIAMSAVPVAGAAGRLSRLPLATKVLGRAAPLAADVVANAGYAAATNPEDRGTSAAFGAGGAVAGRVLTRAMARLARPAGELSAEAKTLVDAGIKPTFGQVMGGGVKKAEDAATNIPVIGGLITKRRQEAQTAFQQATREAALPPGASREAVQSVDQLGKAFNDAYEGVLQSTPFPKEAAAFDHLATVTRLADEHAVTAGQVAQAERIVNNAFKANTGGSELTAAPAHRIESILKSKAANYKSSSDASQRDLGNLLHDVANDWGQTWRGALPDEARQAVGAIDSQYSKFVPVRRAARSGSAATIDEITPTQMLGAIRQGDRNPNKSNFIAGALPQQKFATAAQNVIGSKVSEPGVIPQAVVATALGGGAALGLSPQVLGGALLALGYSTKTVQAYLTGQLAPSAQRAVDEALRGALANQIAAQGGRAAATQGQR